MTLTLEATAIEVTGTLERLEELEKVIKHGIYAVWESVKEIRDNRLYKLKGFDKWDDYCRATFELGQSAVNKLCFDSEVARTLPVINGVVPNPAQVTELKRIKDESERVQAWQQAVETAPDGKVTAKHVRTVVEAVKPEAVKDKPQIDKPVGNPGKDQLEKVVQQSAEELLRELVQDIFNHPYADKRMVEDFLDRARELGVEYNV